MADCPTRRSDVSIRVVDGETVVLDRQAELIHQLNVTASFVWDLCDGQHTAHDMTSRFTESFDVNAETAATTIAAVLRQFGTLGLLEQEPG